MTDRCRFPHAEGHVAEGRHRDGAVLVAKEYLEGELAKAETWEDLETSNKFIKGLFESQRSFETAKGMGVGQTTLLKFLGGNWKQWLIQQALEILKDDKVDREAVEQFPTLRQARAFRDAVKAEKIPKEHHAPLAEKLVKDEMNAETATQGRKGQRAPYSIRGIPESVAQYAEDIGVKPKRDPAPKEPPDITEFVYQLYKEMEKLIPRVQQVAQHRLEFDDMIRRVKGARPTNRS